MTQLMGKTFFISREEAKAQDFINPLKQQGANVIARSLITFELRKSIEHESVLNKLELFDWLVFTSANGVQYFFETLKNNQIPIEKIKHIKMAVVGVKTQQFLEQYGIEVDFVPEVYDAEHFSEKFITDEHPSNVLLIKGNLSRKVIDQALDQSNIPYETLTVYNTNINLSIKYELEDLLNQPIEGWVFTSPSSIKGFQDLIELKDSYLNKPCFCIGHTTRQKAEEVGFQHIRVPSDFTLEGLADVVIDYYS